MSTNSLQQNGTANPNDLLTNWSSVNADWRTFSVSALQKYMQDTLTAYRTYETRALFVTAALTLFPPLGSVVNAAGYSYRYIGTGTAISDLPGWLPFGPAYSDHWGAAGNGVTDDAVAYAAWLAADIDKFYKIGTTAQHPDIRTPVEISITSAGSTVYRMMKSHTALTGEMRNTSGTGFGVLVEPGAAGVSGVSLRDMDIETSGFAVLFKDISLLGGLFRGVSVQGLNIHGGATTADVGVSFDGNTESASIVGNIVTNIQRDDSAPRKAHAFAVAGLAGGGGPTADSANLTFVANAVYDIAGNFLHVEDLSPGVISVANVAKKIDRGLEVINDAVPQLQSHIANSFAQWTSNAIYVAGTGSSRMMNFCFNLMDGALSTAVTAHVRLNQIATRAINYLGNHHANMVGDVMEVTADGTVFVDYNAFDTVTGYAIVGRSTSTTRGLRVGSHNSFDAITSGIIQKAQAANVMGDQIATSFLISNIAATEVLFHAKRAAYLSKVTVTHDDTPLSSMVNSLFSVIKRNAAGTETLLISNFIQHASAAYAVLEWTAENIQIVVNTWSSGDVILLRCDGAGSAANNRSATVQIEFFEYN